MVGKRIPVKRLRSTGFVVAVAILFAAFGGSQYRYVSNSTENLYLKVPKGWKQYKLTDTDKDGRATSLPEGALRVWHYAYDSAAESTADNLKSDSPEHPVTDVQVWALSDGTNDQMSLSKVRSIAFNGFDPLLFPVPPDHVGIVHEPVKETEAKPRRKLLAYDRIKVLLLLSIWVGFGALLKHTATPSSAGVTRFKKRSGASGGCLPSLVSRSFARSTISSVRRTGSTATSAVPACCSVRVEA